MIVNDVNDVQLIEKSYDSDMKTDIQQSGAELLAKNFTSIF